MFNKYFGLVVLLLTFSLASVKAQLVVNTGGSPAQLAEMLSGQGVQILNPQITCPTGGWGTYDANVPSFTSEEGIILATGLVTNAIGPNNVEDRSTNFNAPGNSMLTAVSGFSTRDACMFKFDIIPQGDSLKFDFVFASEEYQEYVGTAYNDVFGFFISGPGIVGDPGLGSFKNIALIPGTNTGVTINNINHGNFNIWPPYGAQNPQYFHPNPLSPNAMIQYDGWTVNLQALAQVVPCQTYELRLIIADATDNVWDSGVFIEKIESNNVQLSSTTIGGTDRMIEGCNDGIVTFTRQNVTNEPLVVEYYLQGTAINGLDYVQIGNPNPNVAKTITIPANQATASLLIEPIADGIPEGLEFVQILIGNPQCANAISDSLSFFIQDSLAVYVDPPLANICEGDGVTFTVTEGGTAFSWSPPTFLNDPNIKEPTAQNVTANTTYTLTTTLSECVATATSTITTENVLIQLSPEHLSCNGSNDGSISATISGGQPNYSYSWTGPNGYTSSQQNITNLTPGTYTLVVNDQNNCQSSESITITQPAPLAISLESPEYTGGFNISCFGGSDGSVIASVLGGTSPYTFSWNDPDNQTSVNPSGLIVGTYQVTVTDANGCVTTASITLSEPSAVTAFIIARQDVLCHGENTGSATVQAGGGVGNYTYSWNTTPPQFGSTASNLTAGVYSVTVTDGNNCSTTISVNIDEPEAPITISTSQQNVLCFGGTTGMVSAAATGGFGTLTYTWNTTPVQTGQMAVNLGAGTYMVTVIDENGCTENALVTITQPASALGVSLINSTDVLCHGEANGGATVQASGGTPPYNYSWNTTPPQTSATASNLSAGNYEVTVTDNNGCTQNLIVVIDEPAETLSLQLNSQQNVNCFGASTGSATVSASGGTGNYTYTWNTSPVTTGSTMSGVPAGSYTVTVTDENNCTDQLTVEITQPAAPLQADITNIQHVLCHGDASGSATVTPSGGTPGYTYLWNDPATQTTATATGLTTGSYNVTVTDANGCTGTINVTINQPSSPLNASIISQTDVLCYGNATGSATIQAIGGSGSYAYLWTPGGYTTSTASNLAAGTYTVQVFDNNGCATPFEITVEINQPSEGLEADLTSPIVVGGWNIACNGDASGSINLDVSGGTAPYEYMWFEANGDTTYAQNLSNVIAGTYTVIIFDQSECTLEASILLTQPDPIDVTFEMTPSLCFGSNEGEIKLEAFGGTPGYNFFWEGPGGFTSTSPDLFELFGGIYELTVTDTNGCVFTSPVTVTQPEDIEILTESLSIYPGGWNVSCHDSEDGNIDISASGGSTPYNFIWHGPNNPFFSNDEDVNGVSGGTYEVVLIDDNNCIQNHFVTLEAPDSILINLDAFQFPGGAELSCAGASDGSITSVVSGGTPDYSYNWSGPVGFPGAISENLDYLPEGTYVLEITDINGCISEQAVRIDPPLPLQVSAFSAGYFGSYNISCNGGSDGSIELTINGGVPGYTVNWQGPNGYSSTEVNPTGLSAGFYCATVTDINGCDEVICITLTEPNELVGTPTAFEFDGGWNIDCYGNASGNITTTVSGGTAPYTYSWDGPGFFTSNQADLSLIGAGLYCLTITDANGCTFETCIDLTQPDPMNISFAVSDYNGEALTCTGADDASLTAEVSGGTVGYDYQWSGPNGFTASTATISNLIAGVYCVTVTDVNNCSETNCFEISEPQPIQITLSSPTYAGGWHIDCNGASTGSIAATVIGGVGGYSYQWSGPNGFTSGSLNLNNLQAGVYCLEVTDVNGCVEMNCISLTQPDALAASPSVLPVACNSEATGSIDLNLSGGTLPYTISWNNGASTEVISNLEAGIYTATIIDANNCVIQEIVEIEQPENLQLTLSSPTFIGGYNIDCNGASTGYIGNNVVGGTAPYIYSWSGPNGFSSTDSSLTNVPAGTYCLNIIDNNGCEASACITLTEPDELTININEIAEILCTNGTDGALQAVVNGGNASYAYSWTGPDGYTAISQTISGLSAGVYCVTVTDINGCSTQNCIAIDHPDPIIVELDSPEFAGGYNINCYQGDDGSISLSASGGTGDFTYFWNGPNGFTASTPNIAGLEAGEYCVVVVDENNCVSEACIVLTEPEALDVALTPSIHIGENNISCFEACDGTLNATVTGGAGPLTYVWTGPDGFTASDTALTGLCAGTYVLMTTDANNCVKTDSFTLVQPELLDIELESPTYGGGASVSCYGGNNGAIISTVSGGTLNYTYLWDGPDGYTSSGPIIDALYAGLYTLTITDANGCVTTEEVEVTEPADSLYAIAEPFVYPGGTNISCHGASDGSIDLTVYGGIGPFTYNWSGAFSFTSQDEDIFDLEAGVYSVVILDANECTFSVNVTLTEPDEVLSAELITNNVSCNAGSDGQITADVSGGTQPYHFEWQGPDGFTSDEDSLSNISAGIYIVTITDVNGCTTETMVEVTEPDAIVVSAEIDHATCDASDGSIAVNASGGTGELSYLWSTGAETASIENLIGGSYTLTVIDENGCEVVNSYEVDGHNPLVLELNPQDLLCHADSTGELSAEVLNATPPVQYEWSGPDGFESSDPVLMDLHAGEYTLTVTDGNNCSATATTTVSQPAPLDMDDLFSPYPVSGVNYNVSTPGGADGSIMNLQISGGSGGYTADWTGPGGFEDSGTGGLTGLSSGTYTVTVTDMNGCSISQSITLTEPYELELPNGFSPNGDLNNDDLIIRGIDLFPQNELIIFNRWGNIVYSEQNYSNDTPWGGISKNGSELPDGTYFMVVKINTGEAKELKGYLELRR